MPSYQMSFKSPNLFLLFIVILFAAMDSHAQGLTPIVESLEERQQVAYIKNAQGGEDKLLQQPLLEAVVSLGPVNEKSSEVVNEINKVVSTAQLDQDSKNQDLQPNLDLFGYEMFNTTPTSFVQLNNIPAPTHYKIGVGDTILVQLYGKKNVEYRLVVQRNGNLLVPEIGPISTTGLDFESLTLIIQKAFEKRVIGVKTTVTLGDLRSIQIMVTGDAVQPGRYTVSGLSTLLNGLLSSGGVRKTGSLRDIRLMRQGKLITRLDLYDVLMRGDTSQDAFLEYGDVIFIPPLGKTVAIGGEVQRPAIYELSGKTNLKQLIDMSGGLLATASIKHSTIERINSTGSRTVLDIKAKKVEVPLLENIVLKNGDLVKIQPILDTYEEMVLLSGNVKRPGAYQFISGMQLTDLIPSVSGLLPNTDTQSGLIRRENVETGKIEILYFNLTAAIQQSSSPHNIVLNQRDEVMVFKRSEDRSERLLSVVEQIRNQTQAGSLPEVFHLATGIFSPGFYPLQRETTLENAINLAGGVKNGVDYNYVLISRRATGASKLHMFSVDLERQGQNLRLMAGDIVYFFERGMDRQKVIQRDIETILQETDHQSLPPVVFIDGKVRFPGQYPHEFGMGIESLIRAAGGLLREAYDKSVEVSHFVIDDEQIRQVSHDVVTREPKDDKNFELSPYDHVRISAKPGYSSNIKVEVKGEVKFPGRYVMRETETLCELLNRAGGLTKKAFPLGAMFLRESVRLKEQKANDRLIDELDDLLVQIHLSPSANNQDKMPAGEQKHEILQAIKQLKQNPAIGRMVIDLEGASNCNGESAIVLEDGDKLYVPQTLREVSVMGQVYMPTSHLHKKSLGSKDYIDLSGGSTVLGRLRHAYVVQANGEVHSMRGSNWFKRAKNIAVTPGATIYVPIDVDRMNGHEKTQSWTKSIFQLAVAAASLNVVGIF